MADDRRQVPAAPLLDLQDGKAIVLIAEGYALKLASASRALWGVEDSLHWVLDVNFRDDDCRICKKNAPANFTAIKRATINASRNAPGKHSLKSKRLIAAWDEDHLAKTLAAL
jgi:hypothetical protein